MVLGGIAVKLAANVVATVAIVVVIAGVVYFLLTPKKGDYTPDKLVSYVNKQLKSGGEKALNIVKDYVQTENEASKRDGRKFQFLLWGMGDGSVATHWEDLVSADPTRIKKIHGRIPHLLPVLRNMLVDLRWVQKGEVASHCLPKLMRDGSVQGQCIPAYSQWHTGNFLFYVPPT